MPVRAATTCSPPSSAHMRRQPSHHRQASMGGPRFTCHLGPCNAEVGKAPAPSNSVTPSRTVPNTGLPRPVPQIYKTRTRLQKHAPIPNNPPGYYGNYDTDSATWPESLSAGQLSKSVSPQPLPRLATEAAPPAAAGPSALPHDGPASRTRSKTKAVSK